MSQKITAIIHLQKRGRTTGPRYGQFLRPDNAPNAQALDLHLWLGRELTIEEFNTEFPKAVRAMGGTETIFGQIIVREVPGDEADIEALKAEHAEALAALQETVNAFTAEHNANLAAAQERIVELEAELLRVTTKPADPISEEPTAQVVEASLVEAAPAVAGEQPQDAVSPNPAKKKAPAKK